MVQVREIKICELLDFIKSDEYKKLDIKPITKLRAISQYNNPDAFPDDLALIYASKNDELLGFAGLLPKFINGENIRIFSNSCWWAHPQKGKTIAIPLFYKLVERAGFSLFLSESTPHAKSILEKTGLFGPIKQNIGIRGFMRFYFADISLKHFPNYRWLAKLVAPFDVILNLLIAPIKYYFLKKFTKNSFKTEEVSKIDKEIEEFINKNSKSELVQKTPASFEWFKNYPWLRENSEIESFNYPFTDEVRKFDLNYFVFKKNNEVKAFVAVSNLDNLSKIPFVYFDSKDIKEVVYSVMQLVLTKKYDSLVVYHPEIVGFIKQNKMPFYLRKKEIKYSGTSKQINNIFEEKPFIQDGDGDVIFT